jgi:hypothetical protein
MKKMLHSRKGRLAMKLREERERERERERDIKQQQEGCKKMKPRK